MKCLDYTLKWFDSCTRVTVSSFGCLLSRSTDLSSEVTSKGDLPVVILLIDNFLFVFGSILISARECHGPKLGRHVFLRDFVPSFLSELSDYGEE